MNKWLEYTKGKQTYTQLAPRYSCSIKTIQRRIDAYNVENENIQPRKVIVLMDTTQRESKCNWGNNKL